MCRIVYNLCLSYLVASEMSHCQSKPLIHTEYIDGIGNPLTLFLKSRNCDFRDLQTHRVKKCFEKQSKQQGLIQSVILSPF